MTTRQKQILVLALGIVIPGGIIAVLLVLGFGRKRPLTDAALVQASASELAKWEGSFGHLYLDTKGLPTTGVGNLVRTLNDVAKLPWQIAGRPAKAHEIATDFASLVTAPWSKAAKFYERFTQIRLMNSDILALLKRRLSRDFLPALHTRFPAWDKLPGPAQMALVDMMYSLGPGAFDKYKTMTHAVQRGDFRAAALASMRTGARQARNDYVRDLFYSAVNDRQAVA